MRHPQCSSRPNLKHLLASSSVAALLIGGGTPAFACYTGPFTGGYNNSGATACIVVNNTSFTGNLSNTGTVIPARRPASLSTIRRSPAI
jgi:hypothetical protein